MARRKQTEEKASTDYRDYRITQIREASKDTTDYLLGLFSSSSAAAAYAASAFLSLLICVIGQVSATVLHLDDSFVAGAPAVYSSWNLCLGTR
jgi:hypothetical protein